MYVYHMQAMPKMLKADTGSPGIRAKDSCELPFGCWESNLGSLEKKKTVSVLNQGFIVPACI